MNKNQMGNTYRTKYRCKSINLSKFINICTDNNIKLYNLFKGERFSTFELDEKDSKLIKKLDLSNFELSEEKGGGVALFKSMFIYHIGFIIGLIVSVVAFFCVQDRMLQLHITGVINIDQSDIEEEIHAYGINYFSNMNFDKVALEKHLAEKFDFSLVSVISKGNSLIVNVKESIRDIESSYSPITADCNMIIKSIEVYAGTKVVNVGDVVFKGDVLVQPYYKSEQDIVYVEPRANIVSDVFFSKSYTFFEKESKMVRTGQTTTLYKSLSLCGVALFKTEKDNSYQNFEIEEKSRNVTNYFLPIVETVSISYELEAVENIRDFDGEKEYILSNLKQEVYQQAFDEIENIKEDVVITDIDGGKIINFSVSGEYVFRYIL